MVALKDLQAKICFLSHWTASARLTGNVNQPRWKHSMDNKKYGCSGSMEVRSVEVVLGQATVPLALLGFDEPGARAVQL